MRKIVMMFLLVSALMVWGMGTAGAVEFITEDVIEKEILTEIDYIKNADNFIILFDSSKTMKETLPGTNKSKLAVAKEILKLRNELMPDLGFNAGLYVYTNPFSTIFLIRRLILLLACSFGRRKPMIFQSSSGFSAENWF